MVGYVSKGGGQVQRALGSCRWAKKLAAGEVSPLVTGEIPGRVGPYYVGLPESRATRGRRWSRLVHGLIWAGPGAARSA